MLLAFGIRAQLTEGTTSTTLSASATVRRRPQLPKGIQLLKNPMNNLEGKVAFVTGGASGLGLAMVRSFLRAGMKVVAADIEDLALQRCKTEFAGNNALLCLQLDVTNRSAMAQAADDSERAFGKVHVLCNNAGVSVMARVDQLSYKDWDWVMGVNLNGVINGLQTFIDRIKRHGEGGHIVNTASIAGQIALQGLTVYNASKYAVVGISETIRQELAPMNIGVSVLCPGIVMTGIGDSARNRPETLKVVENTTAADTDTLPPLDNIFNHPLEPALVGDMVVAGIRNNDPYIFTHPELRTLVEQRFQGIAAGFDRWQAYTP